LKKLYRPTTFKCSHCHKVVQQEALGTANRNHCPFCLWSLHVDSKTSGDKKSLCRSPMEPIGLTFKQEGYDKYTGKPRQGELMVIHRCTGCGKISINRLSGDDEAQAALEVFEKSKVLKPDTRSELEKEGISPLTEKDAKEIHTQLFGKPS
jgi:hypothetical protein